MSKPIITADIRRTTKHAPLTIAIDTDRRWSPKQAIAEVVRYRETDSSDGRPHDNRHFRSANLAIPARTGYDFAAEDFTYPLVLRFDDPRAARELAYTLLEIAETLETPCHTCTDCCNHHPTPCPTHEAEAVTKPEHAEVEI